MNIRLFSLAVQDRLECEISIFLENHANRSKLHKTTENRRCVNVNIYIIIHKNKDGWKGVKMKIRTIPTKRQHQTQIKRKFKKTYTEMAMNQFLNLWVTHELKKLTNDYI